MPYDPAYPPTNALIESAPLRGQFNGLKDLIDALPAINAAQVDGVSTGNPGDPASVTLMVDGSTLRFTFVLPRGETGNPGSNGANGSDGNGVSGAVIDGVTTLNPGDPASASASFDGTTVHFTFGIPRGNDGVPGEVTSAQLVAEINGTSSNSNAVAALAFGAAPDYDPAQQQEIIAKLNELISALRR